MNAATITDTAPEMLTALTHLEVSGVIVKKDMSLLELADNAEVKTKNTHICLFTSLLYFFSF